MTEIEWTDEERKAVVGQLRAWGVRSRHGEWTDIETQGNAASDVLDALAPHVAAREAQAAAKAEGRVKQAIRECHDDPAKAVFDADRLAGEAIIRAHAAEAERDQLRAEVEHLRENREAAIEGGMAAVAAVATERDQLRHLLGSHADGHRCTCEMTDPGTPNISPPEWEQDPWCLTHPDMSVITAEVERLRERLAAVEATADEWEADRGILSPDSRFTRDVLVRELRAALWGRDA